MPWSPATCGEAALTIRFIKLYPTYRSAPQVLGLGSQYGLTCKVIPILTWLADEIAEIDLEDRLDWDNHFAAFPKLVTGLVDSFPVFVHESSNPLLAHAEFSGKYWRHALKFMVGIDLKGRLLVLCGPFPSRGSEGDYDGHIFEEMISPNLFPAELWLGDGHFTINPNVLTTIGARRPLTAEEHEWNTAVSWVRSRVEHTGTFFHIIRSSQFIC